MLSTPKLVLTPLECFFEWSHASGIKLEFLQGFYVSQDRGMLGMGGPAAGWDGGAVVRDVQPQALPLAFTLNPSTHTGWVKGGTGDTLFCL